MQIEHIDIESTGLLTLREREVDPVSKEVAQLSKRAMLIYYIQSGASGTLHLAVQIGKPLLSITFAPLFKFVALADLTINVGGTLLSCSLYALGFGKSYLYGSNANAPPKSRLEQFGTICLVGMIALSVVQLCASFELFALGVWHPWVDAGYLLLWGGLSITTVALAFMKPTSTGERVASVSELGLVVAQGVPIIGPTLELADSVSGLYGAYEEDEAGESPHDLIQGAE